MQIKNTIITWSHILFSFADGINLIQVDLRSLVEVVVPLRGERAWIFQAMNSTKSKFMVAYIDRGRPSDVNVEVVFDGNVSEAVEVLDNLATLVP